MPVIDIDFSDLKGLMGKGAEGLTKEAFLERVPMIGSDIEEVVGDLLRIEFFPDRPDLYSVEGVARAMAAFLGHHTGLRRYDVAKARTRFNIAAPGVPVRPFVVGAVVHGVKFTDQFIRSIMDVQEKLHRSLGRVRKRVAIGLHDLDRVEPPFTYKAADPESITFVPLGMQEELDMREVLRRHDKGREYGWILQDSGHDLWPIILDANDEVLSFPPIINGELTAIKEGTSNVFIDVTGLDGTAVNHALNILCAMFVDRGAHLEAIELVAPDGKATSIPDMRPGHMKVGADLVNRWLGTEMTADDIAAALERMGHGAKAKGHELEVSSPPYRKDILHPVDLVEDVAIGYGYERFTPVMPGAMTVGTPRPIEMLSDLYRKALVGLGYLEVTTLTISNDEDEFTKLGAEADPRRALIANPTSEAYSSLRVSLVPSLLRTLRANKHRDLPQRIFELGDVIIDGRNIRHVAAMSVHERANFTEMKSIALALLRDMRVEHRFAPSDGPGFMKGRCAAIVVDNETIGHLGELSPEAITAFELEFPVGALEMRI